MEIIICRITILVSLRLKMYEDFNYRLKQSLVDVNKDIFALHYQFEDMQDEINKRKMPLPAQGEVLIKLD